MGIIVSPTEKDQFIEGLKYARGEGGWSDVDIARTLSVSNGDFKNMLTGHKPPSQKHIDRLNNLMHSSPPKRLTTPPPAPSRPAMVLPDFTTQKPVKSEMKVLYVGDDGGAPRVPLSSQAAAAPTASAPEPPKESNDMTTTEAVNGMSHKAKKHLTRKPRQARAASPSSEGKQKSRGRRGPRTPLAKTELVVFRREIKEAIEAAGGNMSKVARGMEVDRNTIANIVNGEGGSKETLEKFREYRARLTGTIAEARRSAPRRKLLNEYGPSETGAEPPPPADPLDLYGMAGRLLALGRIPQAHLLSLVAKIMEGPGVERVNEVLRRLLPKAAVG